MSTGEREIEPVEAAVVERIFREFVSGRSPKQIAKTLNQQGVAGPFGGKWSPGMAELYRQEVTDLAQALQRSDTRMEASEAIRGLMDAIVLTPSQGALQIELRGNLAAMLSAAQNAKRSPEGDLSLPIAMVAGARNQLNLDFCWAAA